MKYLALLTLAFSITAQANSNCIINDLVVTYGTPQDIQSVKTILEEKGYNVNYLRPLSPSDYFYGILNAEEAPELKKDKVGKNLSIQVDRNYRFRTKYCTQITASTQSDIENYLLGMFDCSEVKDIKAAKKIAKQRGVSYEYTKAWISSMSDIHTSIEFDGHGDVDFKALLKDYPSCN